MGKTCRECRHWVDLTGVYRPASAPDGRCERFPPTPVVSDGDLSYVRPKTHRYDSCGEYEPELVVERREERER